MRIVSWNVNGIRACTKKGFIDWLEASEASIVGVQEVRATAKQVPAALREHTDWHCSIHSAERAGYSGVGLLSRQKPDVVQASIDDPDIDAEGRLQLARFGKLLVVNGYFPNGNGQNRDHSRIPFKLDFYRTLFDALEPMKERGEAILVMGDFNTAHREIDLARPKQNHGTSGFTPPERDEFDRWLRSGWVDTFRQFEDGAGHYTWWSQRFGVRERNIGWRIDYILASPGAEPFLRGAAIHPDVMGSDHCPISVVVDPAIVG